MSTPAEDTRTPQVELLIGESFDSVDARLYVYRDNGSGRVEGTYMKRYEQRVELEDLRRDLGPGMYVLMQNRGPGGRPVTRRVFVPAEPGPIIETTATPTPADGNLRELRSILEMKMIADQLKPREIDPLKMIQTVMELVRGNQPRDPLEAFLQGAKWGGDGDDSSPGALLASAGARAIERRFASTDEPAATETPRAVGPGDLSWARKFVAAFNERMSKTDRLIAELAARVNGGNQVSVSLLEIFQALLVGSYESGQHVAVVLRIMDKSSGGALRRELESYVLEDLSSHMKTALEQNGHAERFDSFHDGLLIFLQPKGA